MMSNEELSVYGNKMIGSAIKAGIDVSDIKSLEVIDTVCSYDRERCRFLLLSRIKGMDRIYKELDKLGLLPAM